MPNVSLWLIMPLILSTNLLALLHTKSLYKDVIIYNDIISQIIMKRMRIIVSICVMLCTSLLTKAQNQILTLDDLDHEIAMSPRYDKKFEDYIRSVKKQLHDARTNQARYELSDKLFNLYTSYSVDSAIVYALNKQKIAKQMGINIKSTTPNLTLPTSLFEVVSSWKQTTSLTLFLEKKSVMSCHSITFPPAKPSIVHLQTLR